MSAINLDNILAPSRATMPVTQRTVLIREFLLAAVKAGSQSLIADAMAAFKISRQAVHGHLSALMKSGYLVAHGNTRARQYTPGVNRLHRQSLLLAGLRESDVYYREFGFMFKELPREIEEICQYGFTEMLNNAIDHSGGTVADISVSRTDKAITILVVDDGEGIFNRIVRILNYVDPRESLFELSKGKLTTDPRNHSGQGIFFTSRVFDEFSIYSDELIFSHVDNATADYLTHHDQKKPGTAVYMKLSLNSFKVLKTIFDEYTGNEQENYAFNKTVVPLRLAVYETERLVSRSQAKRIVNRIDKFKTVLLDFHGVEFIGQAFADEIFRVFARRNQQITLIPLNMAKEVEKMVRAAINSKD